MNNYFYPENTSRNKTLVIVEGKLEKNIILKTLLLCFPEIPVKYENVYVYSSDIYDLYHAIEKEYEENWYEDDLLIDLPLLISRKFGIEPQLDRRDFTNIILIFDYEHHDNWYSDEKILRMQRHFNNASEDGILYVNYPMIESVYHFREIPDNEYISRSVPVTCNPGKEYKKLVASESVIMDYLKLFDKLSDWLYRKISTSYETIESFTYALLSSKSLKEVDNVVEQISLKTGLTEEDTYNMKCALSSMMSKYPFINKSISYWNDLRDLFMYIFKENVNKSSYIQKMDGQECLSVKDRYNGIEWSEVLKQQNMFSSDVKNGVIFVLCTCITFLGEYKFCWTKD